MLIIGLSQFYSLHLIIYLPQSEWKKHFENLFKWIGSSVLICTGNILRNTCFIGIGPLWKTNAVDCCFVSDSYAYPWFVIYVNFILRCTLDVFPNIFLRQYTQTFFWAFVKLYGIQHACYINDYHDSSRKFLNFTGCHKNRLMTTST